MDRKQCLPNTLYIRGFDFTYKLGVLSYKNTPTPYAATRLINTTLFVQLEQIEFSKWAHMIPVRPMSFR